MGRRKQEEAVVVEESTAPDRESTQILNSADVESAEAELLNDGENPVEETKTEENKPRQRRSRKKAEEQPVLAVEHAPPPTRQSRGKKETETPVPAASFATENMEEMVRQWNTIKEITSSITQNFEKLQGAFPKVPSDYMDTAEFFKPQAAKVPFITKFATGASLVATLLSVLSLSLSQSARNAALSHEVAARQAQSATAAPQIAYTAPEIKHPQLPQPSRRKNEMKENFFRVKK